MANRYWMGGNWSNTANWSATNNGAGGASIPTATDSVYWHTIPVSSVYTIDAAASCLDMDWTGATNTPTLAGTQSIQIHGSMTLISAMTLTYTGLFDMEATSTGKTITTAGKTLLSNLVLGGVGGGWTLQDSLTSTNSIVLNKGTFDTNGKTVSCSGITSNTGLTRTLILGASVITLTTDWFSPTSAGLTLNAGTSTIILTSPNRTFESGGLAFNIVTFSGTNITVLGANTFATLTQAKGTTLKLTSGTTQTITNPVFNGTTASPSTLQSTIAGTPATIVLPAGRYLMRHTSIKDITISGATTVTNIAGTNVSGNTGITFVTKFEMGRIKNDGSFNWYSTTTGTVDKVSG